MGKRAKPDDIIANLREFEIRLARGEMAAQAARAVGLTEQSYYRWRKEYGGLQTNQVVMIPFSVRPRNLKTPASSMDHCNTFGKKLNQNLITQVIIGVRSFS